MVVVEGFINFLRKITGIRWYLIVDRDSGSIIDKSPILSEKDATELSEVVIQAGELSSAIANYTLFSSTEKAARTLFIRSNGEGPAIENVGGKVIALNIDERLLPVLSSILESIRGNKTVKCNKCGRSLMLETIVCPKCGRTIPFMSEKCPFCGYSVRVKKCPGCGSYVDLNGNVLKRDMAIIAAGIGIGVLVALISAFIGMSFTGPVRIMFYGLGGLLGVLMLLIGYYVSLPR